MKWQPCQLQGLCAYVASGGTPSTSQAHYYGGTIPWLRTQEVTFNRITETEMTITEDGLANSAARWVPEHSVIVAMYGNSAGRVAVNLIPLTTNQACCNLILDPSKADYRFVFYRLMLDYDALHQMAKGAAQNNLNAGQVKSYSIHAPDVTEQRAIADVLSAYDDLIENNRRRMGLLEETARLLYREWFVRLRFPGHERANITHGLPEGWERKPLVDIAPDLRDAANPADLEPGTPYIGLEHMPRRSITLSEWGAAEQVTSAKLRYKVGDILFGKIRPYFHKVGFALTDGVSSSDSIILRPVAEELHAFVLLAVSSDWFVAVVSKTAKEGSKMPRADWNLMERHELAVPPVRILNAFRDVVYPIVSQLKTLAFQNQKLRAARDLLLPKLMSGEVAA